MKFTTTAALLVHAVTILAAPTILSQENASTSLYTDPAVNNGPPGEMEGDAETSGPPGEMEDDAEAAGPRSWRLDCGAPGTTNMCSASNSGAHCDPITGSLTIILGGTCGACKCIAADNCTGRCG